MKHVPALVGLAVLAVSGPVAAQAGAQSPTPIEALSRCVAENTTGKDRKDLARWLFVAMSAHPEMKSISPAPREAADEVSRITGALFTRLMAETCRQQVRAAIQAGGPAAIQAAFGVLGQLAMQELMADKDVAATMGLLDRYVDREKLDAAMR